jgi:hypothetical protein
MSLRTSCSHLVVLLVIFVKCGSDVLVGSFNMLAGDEPLDLRMQVLPPTTIFNGLPVTLTEN